MLSAVGKERNASNSKRRLFLGPGLDTEYKAGWRLGNLDVLPLVFCPVPFLTFFFSLPSSSALREVQQLGGKPQVKASCSRDSLSAPRLCRITRRLATVDGNGPSQQ